MRQIMHPKNDSMQKSYLYHYTKFDAAINIIRNGLCFRGFRYDSMNDPTEYTFARDKILPKITKDNSWKDDDVYPYIVSFCKAPDSDIMWRLYQGDVALVIDSQIFPLEKWSQPGDISDNVFLGDVKYATDETIDSVAKELYDKRREDYDDHRVEYQLWVLPFIKHKAFEMEKEFRLAKMNYDSCTAKYNPQSKDRCTLHEHERPNEIECIYQNGALRLYKEFCLPKECLVGIIIHTFDDEVFKRQKRYLELWLMQNDYSIDNIEIRKTRSYPIR